MIDTMLAMWVMGAPFAAAYYLKNRLDRGAALNRHDVWIAAPLCASLWPLTIPLLEIDRQLERSRKL